MHSRCGGLSPKRTVPHKAECQREYTEYAPIWLANVIKAIVVKLGHDVGDRGTGDWCRLQRTTFGPAASLEKIEIGPTCHS